MNDMPLDALANDIAAAFATLPEVQAVAPPDHIDLIARAHALLDSLDELLLADGLIPK